MFNQFSTDNYQSDQMQLDEEQFDDQEDQMEEHLPEDYEEDPFYVEAVAACFETLWWNRETIEEDKFEAFTERQKQLHNEECDCGDESNFRCNILD